MRVVVGCDHAGLDMKEQIVGYLKTRQVTVEDKGTHSLDSVDYPDIAAVVAREVLKTEGSLGILICGTGLGMALTANKIKGIRAVTVSEPFSARMSRAHNNANILTFGGRVVGIEVARMIVDAFLDTSFEAGRHQRRVDKIMAHETEGASDND